MIPNGYEFGFRTRGKRPALFLFFLALLVLRAHGVFLEWRHAKGWEYEWVATSLASGHGYAFHKGFAPLGLDLAPAEYSPTAWVEPLQTVIIAASFRIFGEYGRLVLILINFIWAGATCWLIFLLVERLLGAATGVATATLFALLPFGKADLLFYIGPAAMASCLFIVCAYQLIKSLDHPSLTRSVALGATIGIANLTHAGSLLFAPLAVAIILTALHDKRSQAWKSAGALVITTIVIVSPWMLRNYLTFDQVVVVRNGFGFQLYVGNPGLAQTFAPEIRNQVGKPSPWTASSPRAALALLRELGYDRALRLHVIATIGADPPSGYEYFNEAQRDRIYLSRAIDFMRSRPVLTLKVVAWKMYAFFANWGLVRSLIAVAAIVGWLCMMLRDPRIAILMSFLAVYALPFWLSLPLYYRYRTPVEPFNFVLIGILVKVFLEYSSAWMESTGFLKKIAR